MQSERVKARGPRLRGIATVARSLVDHLELFWVSGLALLLILAVQRGTKLQGEPREWAQYVTLGTLFPCALLLLALPIQWRLISRLQHLLRMALAAFGAVVAALFLIEGRTYVAIGCALLQGFVTLLMLRASKTPHPEGPLAVRLAEAFAALAIVTAAWVASVYLESWTPFMSWIRGSQYTLLVFLLTLLLVLGNLFYAHREPERPQRLLSATGNLAALLLLGMASLRSQILSNSMAYHHWGVFVGTAELVRHGGWLLWDVPSQYGFLSILAVAAIPTHSAWQAMYLVNALLLFLSAAFLFYLLRSLRSGVANFIFSLAVTLAAVFMLPGWGPVLAGPQITPAAAAYRFFWCYALLGILFWEFQSSCGRIPDRRILTIGCLVWLAGTLWSCESAVYCSAIWLPAYVLLLLRRISSQAGLTSRQQKIRLALSWLLLPPLLLLVAGVGLSAYYVLRLGHLPDWQMFTEYVFSFGAGYGALPIDLFGPVWALFVVFCAVSATAVFLLRGGLTHAALPLISGVWGALWATSSYFVGRSHPIVALDLAPILFTTIALILFILTRAPRSDSQVVLLKMSLVPVLTVLLTATFGNATAFPQYPRALWESRYVREIEGRLPEIDPSLASLLNEAGVRPTDPLVYLDVNLLPPWFTAEDGAKRWVTASRAWLPVTPLVQLWPLRKARAELYIARFTQRARLSGWLIEPSRDTGASAWLREQLRATHHPTRVFRNADYRLTWFQYGPSTADARPPGARVLSHTPTTRCLAARDSPSAFVMQPRALAHGIFIIQPVDNFVSPFHNYVPSLLRSLCH